MADVWFVADKNQNAADASSTSTTSTDLRSRVGGLVQAMASFDNATSSSSSGTGSLTAPVTGTESATPLASVGGLVDVLKQFDANGNVLGTTPLAQSATPTPSLTSTAALTNPLTTGVLTTGKS